MDQDTSSAEIPPQAMALSRRLERTLGALVAATLFSMMTLTFIDVFGRYLFNAPVPGAFELTQLAMGVLVFGALPLATIRDEHISITLLDGLWRGKARRWQLALVNVVSAGALALLGWRIALHGAQLAEYGEATLFLRIGFAPFVYFMSAMAAVGAATALALAAFQLGPPGDSGGSSE